MGVVVDTPPIAEPLTLAEAKEHLRVDFAEDDGLIASYLAAARQTAEERTGLAAVERTLIWSGSCFPKMERQGGEILLPHPPLIAVERVEYIDRDGVLQVLPAEDYEEDVSVMPGRLVAVPGKSWPVTDGSASAAAVIYRAGYGAPPAVADTFKHLVRLLLANFYEQREPVITGTIATELPLGAQALINLLRPEPF